LIRRFIVLTAEQADTLALWAMHTHAFQTWTTTPYLAITSPTLRAGKSRLFEVLELVVARAWKVGSITPAALYRTIAERKPTALVDELDAQSVSNHLRGVLNEGWREGGVVTRVESVDGVRVPVDFQCFCPKAFAGIGRPLPPTVMDRCIPIMLKRRAPNEIVERFRARDVKPVAQELRRDIEHFASRNFDVLGAIRPVMPDHLSDRAADVWEPLFAIADHLGYGWPGRIRRASDDLHDQEDEIDPGVQLLADCFSAFEAMVAPRAPTTDLIGALRGLDDPSYAHHAHREAGDLARALRAFGIRPKMMRFGDRTRRGYERLAFEDAWHRYLGVKPEQAKQAQPSASSPPPQTQQP